MIKHSFTINQAPAGEPMRSYHVELPDVVGTHLEELARRNGIDVPTLIEEALRGFEPLRSEVARELL